MNPKNRVDDPAGRQRGPNYLHETKRPRSLHPGQIADALGLTWITSKNLLMDLSLSGELSATKTARGWLFGLPRATSRKRRVNGQSFQIEPATEYSAKLDFA